MIALIQRVSSASVVVDGQTVGAIDRGVLALIGVQPDDGDAQAARLIERVSNYRIFEDEEGRMNRSVVDIEGGLLLVPQFTLAANTRKGNRPSFTAAAPPALGTALFDRAVAEARQRLSTVETGIFGANMAVHLINDGPVTFWLEA